MGKFLISAVVAAAGQGNRMRMKAPKQFLTLGNIPVFVRTLCAFEESEVDDVIVVTLADEIERVRSAIRDFGIKKVSAVTGGGKTRQESVMRGLEFVRGDYVLIHDGARPFVTANQINSVVSALYEHDAAALGVPVKDTLKSVNKDGFITDTIDRESLFSIQTPQGFKTELIKEAHRRAAENGILATDDCALAESMGVRIKLVEGSAVNIKITTRDDLTVANGIIESEKGR